MSFLRVNIIDRLRQKKMRSASVAAVTDSADRTPASRGRGRPSVVDHDAVAEAAILLWTERGYEQTTWRDLAEATGVSERTLLRHFQTRAAIAWTGVDAARERLAAALAAAAPEEPLADVLRHAVVNSVSHDSVRRLGSQWATLVSTEPELAAFGQRSNLPWTADLADYIAGRVPDAPRAVANAVAAAYEAASRSALIDWAAGDAGDPADAVDAALRWLRVDPR